MYRLSDDLIKPLKENYDWSAPASEWRWVAGAEISEEIKIGNGQTVGIAVSRLGKVKRRKSNGKSLILFPPLKKGR